jgi:hypothetical protein
MGWLFTYDKRTRAALVEYLRRPERYGENQELLRSSVVGNNHWYLCRDRRDGKVWIGLDKMAGGGHQSMGWGYKDMSEDMGPVEVNCPLSFLNEASPVTEGWAAEWRERVRAYHARRKERPKPAPGSVVRYGDHDYKLLSPAGPRRGWYVERLSDTGQFRMRAKQLAHSQFVQGAAA